MLCTPQRHMIAGDHVRKDPRLRGSLSSNHSDHKVIAVIQLH